MQDSAAMRMQMISTLQQECVIVQGAIDHLITCRKRLEENIAQAKAQVSGDATDALDTLRSREIQLLRQIDVIETHHANVLLLQHAKLNQLLGNLKHTLYCARHQQNVPVNSVSDEDMEVVHEVNRLREIKNPLISFYCDMNQIVSAIQNFGIVESTGNLMNAERDDVVSRCLPSRVEEYEDSEHQLLYKTLAELKLEVGGRQQVSVAFPKLSTNKEDWLRMDYQKSLCNSASAVSGNRPNFVLPDHLVDSDTSRWLKGHAKQSTYFDKLISRDGCIENWLRRQIVQTKRNVQQQQSLPTDAVVAAASSDCSYSCGASESIEMISNPDTVDSITNDFTWLASPSQLFKQNLRVQTKKDGLHCRVSSSVDIENLGNVSCAMKGVNKSTLPFKDRHLWLACKGGINGVQLEQPQQEEEDGGDTIGGMAIDEVCCANEPCRSFSDCVCDVACCDVLNNVDKNRKPTAVQYSDLVDWLKNPKKEWLRYVDLLVEMEKMDVSEKAGVGESMSGGEGEGSTGNRRANWLKNYLVSIDEIPFNVRQDFLSYFMPANPNEWLAS